MITMVDFDGEYNGDVYARAIECSLDVKRISINSIPLKYSFMVSGEKENVDDWLKMFLVDVVNRENAFMKESLYTSVQEKMLEDIIESGDTMQ